MKNNTKIKQYNYPRTMLQISNEVAEKAKAAISEINSLKKSLPNDEKENLKNSLLKRQKKKDILVDLNRKLSLKSFTEAALLYFVENKIDPTLYNDATLKTEITRLRNQLFSFNVIHEQKILKEFSSLEAALEASTKSISTETIEGNNETQSFIAGLLEVMFQVFEVKGDEREKIVIAFKKKMIEFQEFNA